MFSIWRSTSSRRASSASVTSLSMSDLPFFAILRGPGEPDKPPPPKLAEYFLSLGEFVTVFAGAERALFFLSGMILRLPLSVAQAVFGGSARVKESTDRLNRAVRSILQEQPNNNILTRVKTGLDRALPQLGLINTVRNEILHYGITDNQDEHWTVTNSHLRPDSPSEFKVSANILSDMTYDTRSIIMILAECMGQIDRQSTGESKPYLDLLQQPWRYKPSLLRPSPQESASSGTEHQPRPESSGRSKSRPHKRQSSAQKRKAREAESGEPS